MNESGNVAGECRINPGDGIFSIATTGLSDPNNKKGEMVFFLYI
jgi:hypothetical protein